MKCDVQTGLTRQRGITLPMLALFIVILFTFAALAVDLGVLYTARTSAQHAADAAALAGAFTFTNDSNAADPVVTAQQAAIAVAGQDKIMGQSVAITAANVAVDTSKYRVTVTVPRTGANAVETFFARVIGFNSVNVSVTATAEAARNSTGTFCLKPFYMPMQIGAGCSGGSIFDANGKLKSQYVGIQIPNGGLWNNIEPSQWGLLALGGRGGSNLRDSIGTCFSDAPIQCGDSLGTEPGRKVGPVMQGVDDLITNDGAVSPDQWSAVANYIDGVSGIHKVTSRSLVTVAVWDCADPIAHGRNGEVTVGGFAEVFIDGVSHQGNTGGIAGHLVSASQCGTGAGGVTTGTGPFAVPVRLIQTPTGQ
jgi:Flp pilus assembly protein TadG